MQCPGLQTIETSQQPMAPQAASRDGAVLGSGGAGPGQGTGDAELGWGMPRSPERDGAATASLDRHAWCHRELCGFTRQKPRLPELQDQSFGCEWSRSRWRAEEGRPWQPGSPSKPVLSVDSASTLRAPDTKHTWAGAEQVTQVTQVSSCTHKQDLLRRTARGASPALQPRGSEGLGGPTSPAGMAGMARAWPGLLLPAFGLVALAKRQ